MKTCPNCGYILPDEVYFCNACGVAQPVSAPAEQTPPVAQPEYFAMPAEPVYAPAAERYVPPAETYAPVVEEKKVISVGGWMGRDLIAFIPVAGPIVYFIMLWIWAVNKDNEESFRNWAKSRLVWMVIGMGIGVLFLVLLVALGLSFSDLLNETLYY